MTRTEDLEAIFPLKKKRKEKAFARARGWGEFDVVKTVDDGVLVVELFCYFGVRVRAAYWYTTHEWLFRNAI
jgi:hypothetical protein